MAKNLGLQINRGNVKRSYDDEADKAIDSLAATKEEEAEVAEEKVVNVPPKKKASSKQAKTNDKEERKIKRLTFEIYEDQHRKLKILAAQEGKKMVDYVREWMDKHLKD